MKRKRNDLRERARLEAAAALGITTVETVFVCSCGFEWSKPWLAPDDECIRCHKLNIGALISTMEPEDDGA